MSLYRECGKSYVSPHASSRLPRAKAGCSLSSAMAYISRSLATTCESHAMFVACCRSRSATSTQPKWYAAYSSPDPTSFWHSPFQARTMSLKELMQATCILILVYDNFDLLDNFVLTSCIIPPRTFVRSLGKRGALDSKRSHLACTQLLLLCFSGSAHMVAYRHRHGGSLATSLVVMPSKAGVFIRDRSNV